MLLRILIGAVLLLFSCTENTKENLYSIDGFTMGTTYSVKVLKGDKLYHSYDFLRVKIDSVLVEVNRQMSTYIDTSEISLFNASDDTGWVSVSKELVIVIDEALKTSEVSGGASDITIGPLVNLWGFGPDQKVNIIPDPQEIARAKSRLGFRKLHADLENYRIKKDNSEIYCELSSIAKGHGVDRVSRVIKEFGFTNFLVEIGGEVRTGGRNHLNKPWRIGVSSPNRPDGIEKVIDLSDMAMATSGDYRNYFEEKGVRYSHLIDPRTARPITHNLASVTVLHKECMTADALATAINVAGPEEGAKIAEKLQVPYYMIIREENRFIEIMSESFKALISSN